MLPHGLEEFGLKYALEMLCDKVEAVSLLSINLDVETLERLENRLELALYRILQELLNNTIKHAEATEVDIIFSSDNKLLSITYRDNGKGFDITSLTKRGLGLKNIESRVSMVSGKLTYIQTVEKGIEVNMSILL
jgi:signal transduction histidine kinase